MISPTANAETYLDDDADTEPEYAEDSPEATPKHGTSVQSGWGAAKEALKKKEGDFAVDFKPTEEPQVVRFLENEPFSVYFQHWIERKGKKSFVCLGEEECPLCNMVGDTPRPKIAFNVLVVSDAKPTVQVLTAASTLGRQLEVANGDARRGPLTRHYWAISRIGTGNKTTFTLDRVKVSDLADDWEIEPNQAEELSASAKKYDTSAIYVNPKSDLVAVAKELLGDND
jgi:hypothetical protein